MSQEVVPVGLVHDTLGRGGAERVVVTLANALASSRFRPHVILTRTPGELAAELDPAVGVHALDRGKLWDLAALRRFRALAGRLGLAIVHTHSHTASYFARLALGRGGPAHVVHDHYPLIHEDRRLRWADRLLLRDVDHYFAVSEPLARYASGWLRLPPDRCERLLNGIALPAESGRVGRREPFTVVQVARVTPQKDHGLALEVAARLRDSLDDFRWLCVGRTSSDHAGDCLAAADRLGLGERVRFLGERSDVRDLLRSAHVGVLTSREEGLPIALLEYMAASLPVVVTDVGDCGRVVAESGGGVAVPAGDAGSLAEALWALAADPARAERWGRANRAHVEVAYSSAAMARRVEEVYGELLDGPT